MNNISDIEKDFGFQKKEWHAYRIFWILMGVFLLLGILGLFGDGIFTKGRSEAENTQIEYDRFLRIKMNSKITINLNEFSNDSTVSISCTYLKYISITQILPEPISMESKDNYLTYRFSPAHPEQIVLFIDPQKFGTAKVKLKIGSKEMNFNQFVFF